MAAGSERPDVDTLLGRLRALEPTDEEVPGILCHLNLQIRYISPGEIEKTLVSCNMDCLLAVLNTKAGRSQALDIFQELFRRLSDKPETYVTFIGKELREQLSSLLKIRHSDDFGGMANIHSINGSMRTIDEKIGLFIAPTDGSGAAAVPFAVASGAVGSQAPEEGAAVRPEHRLSSLLDRVGSALGFTA